MTFSDLKIENRLRSVIFLKTQIKGENGKLLKSRNAEAARRKKVTGNIVCVKYR